MIDENTSRADLEIIILENDDLYEQMFGGDKLNNNYTVDELLTAVKDWIEAGDETYQF